MPRCRQAAALRSQLAASQDEVRSLKEQVAQGTAQNAEHEATERLLLAKLVTADARCRDAEQRAQRAEMKLIPYTEAHQRTVAVSVEKQERNTITKRWCEVEPAARAGVEKDEGEEQASVFTQFPAIAEAIRRSDIEAAEGDAWAALGAALADSREAVRSRRKTLRRRNQRWQAKHRERGDPTPQVTPPAPATQNEREIGTRSGEVVNHATGARDRAIETPDSVVVGKDSESTCTSTTGVSTTSAKALLIDHICFWIAAFTPRFGAWPHPGRQARHLAAAARSVRDPLHSDDLAPPVGDLHGRTDRRVQRAQIGAHGALRHSFAPTDCRLWSTWGRSWTGSRTCWRCASSASPTNRLSPTEAARRQKDRKDHYIRKTSPVPHFLAWSIRQPPLHLRTRSILFTRESSRRFRTSGSAPRLARVHPVAATAVNAAPSASHWR
eukprot:TRINITY_DN17805_c1_g2_i1.p1 TRINITY_DN17805_c1_g2~~TRINITY_DN17805_c1_g2_i1.p1  ORF type:complete len:464 (+),score=29.01 TRINITY_DN17805_c1_g2_i1:73-1392(+)